MRRAKAVQNHFDSKLKGSFRYFSSSVTSFGERFAGQKEHELYRRVDIYSSFVPKRPVIQMPEIFIYGKVPDVFVSRPVQFLDIERSPIFGEADQNTSRPPYHVIIIEKYMMIKDSNSFPYNMKIPDTTVHKFFPLVRVNRCKIDWRKPEASDTVKKVSSFALNILAGAVGGAKGFDLGEGIPKLEPPNIIYKSWTEYIADAKGSDRDYFIYKDKNF